MGSGFKDWAAADVLTAADVDGYLMRQTVMTFASASARDTALTGVLDEGMFCYTTDTDTVYYYSGAAWITYSTLWTAFTPSWTNMSIGNGTQTAVYRYEAAHTLRVRVHVSFGSTTSVSGTVTLTIPNSETASASAYSMGRAMAIDSTAGSLWIADGTTPILPFVAPSGTTIQFASVATSPGFNATRPHTWAVNDDLAIDIPVAI